jgi:hypothetical protein
MITDANVATIQNMVKARSPISGDVPSAIMMKAQPQEPCLTNVSFPY